MKLEKIILFGAINSQYGAMHQFTEQLAQAFNRQGVHCLVLYPERNHPGEFIDEILKERPDCTLSFNGLLPDDEGRFLCDMIGIPHVAYIIDPPNHFFSLGHSPRTIVASIDRDFCNFFRGLHCQHVLFSPHAIDKNLMAPAEEKRIYDVLMLSSFIDYEAVRNNWKKLYSPALCEVLNEAAEITLSDTHTSFIQAFVQALDHALKASKPIDPLQLNLPELFDEIELYVRGVDRIELVKALQGIPVHIFGSGNTKENWKKYLGKNDQHIILHDAISIEEAENLMRKSKIVLNSSPRIKNGAHERLFAGLACGAAVVSNDNAYVREILVDGKDVVLYQTKHWNDINKKVKDLLSNEDKRRQMAKSGREKVMLGHTWDHRVQAFMKLLPPILEKISHI